MVATLRPFLAENGQADYDLGLVSGVASSWRMPVHVHFPHPYRHQVEQLRGRRTLEMLLLEPQPQKHLALFPDGTIVAFDMSSDEVRNFRESIQECTIQKEEAFQATRVVREGLFTVFDALPALGFENPEGVNQSYVDEGELNAIVLKSDDPVEKLPFIQCLGELIQIDSIAASLKPIAEKVQTWQDKVKVTGHLPCSLTETRMVRARLHRLESRQAKIDSRQQIFWTGEFNHLRTVYNEVYDYYEVQHRNHLLKSQMEAVAASLGYLSEETHAETNHRLEWVVIILIFLSLMSAILTH